MVKNNIVITGIGVVSPVGNNQEDAAYNLLNGNSGVSRIPSELFDTEGLKSRIAGRVEGPLLEGRADSKEVRAYDRLSMYALDAAHQAAEDSGFEIGSQDPSRLGVILGNGSGGLETLEGTINSIAEKRIKGKRGRAGPFDVIKFIPNMPPSHISKALGFEGESYTIATACSSASYALGEATRKIRDGYLDAALSGGMEASITDIGLASFGAMRALSTKFNERPTEASRPFDINRDGFVMGEGAVTFLLEREDLARARGAKIYATISGYAANTGSENMVEPSVEGEVRVMNEALKDARMNPSQIDYVHAHGTSTPKGDPVEIQALKETFGDGAKSLLVSATKSTTGHMVAASSAMGVFASVLALQGKGISPTINLIDLDPRCVGVNHVANQAVEEKVRAAIVNAFGFGGQNASLVLT